MTALISGLKRANFRDPLRNPFAPSGENGTRGRTSQEPNGFSSLITSRSVARSFLKIRRCQPRIHSPICSKRSWRCARFVREAVFGWTITICPISDPMPVAH